MPARALLTNHHFKNFAGSELLTLDLYQALINRGYEVEIATFLYADPLKEHCQKLGINVTNILRDSLQSQEYELVWSHHFPVLVKVVLEDKIKFSKLVLSSLSPYEPLESIQIFDNLASTIVCNSYETKKKLETYLSEDSTNKLHVFPNSVPSSWFRFFDSQKTLSKTIQKIAIVTNHPPQELLDFQKYAVSQNYTVEIIGAQHKFALVTPELLSFYDVIISIGRTVQHCMAIGIPVYCYDHFGGPGWITPENLKNAEFFNYSGRCCKTIRNHYEILDDLCNGYGAALRTVPYLQTYARDFYSFDKNFDWVCKEIGVENNLSESAVKSVELPDEIRIKVGFLSQLYIRVLYESNELVAQLSKSQLEFQQANIELNNLKHLLQSIEKSKFWKVRKAWLRLKHMLGKHT
ncbi:hypothetical protein [Almyronema epifaneia]|uniref:Glycosyltransferase family 1 protein n=1 Tax=Almyronema epifaneia S1 TaxID=2991925 RepID=A0ABW6IAQ0_9CYAN